MDACPTQETKEKKKTFVVEHKLCFICGSAGHRANGCRGGGCHSCQGRHHTSLCDRKRNLDMVLNAHSLADNKESLPAIVPIKVQEKIMWAYLDTGFGRNFISYSAVKRLKLEPVRNEARESITVNGSREQGLPIYNLEIRSVDGKQEETGSEMHNFTTIKRPDISVLRTRLDHAKDKQFYVTRDNRYPIDLIIGDSLYCKIKTD